MANKTHPRQVEHLYDKIIATSVKNARDIEGGAYDDKKFHFLDELTGALAFGISGIKHEGSISIVWKSVSEHITKTYPDMVSTVTFDHSTGDTYTASFLVECDVEAMKRHATRYSRPSARARLNALKARGAPSQKHVLVFLAISLIVWYIVYRTFIRA